MICTLFYSWQSDLPNPTSRGFIQKALEDAAKVLRREDTLKIEPVVDRDTQNVPGSPDIGQTIFAKIDHAQAFVCDVSAINNLARNPDGSLPRPTPNPNVLIELGYAARALGWERIILVVNTDYGPVESLPFDLRQKRTLTYSTQGEESKGDKRRELQGKLEGAIREILKSIESQPVAPTGPTAELLLSSEQGDGSSLKQTIYSIIERPSMEERIKMEQNAILGIKPQPHRSWRRTEGGALRGVEALMANPPSFDASSLLSPLGVGLGFVDAQWRENIERYIKEQYEPYLEKRDSYLDALGRMIPVRFVLKNDGTAPVEGVHLIVRCPPQVVVRAELPTRPEVPKRPEKPDLLTPSLSISGIVREMYTDTGPRLSDLLRPDPLKPEISDNGIVRWRPGDLQHHLPLRLPSLFAFVVPSVEPETLLFGFEIHGKNLPTPVKGELAVEVTRIKRRWVQVEVEEEQNYLAAQKQQDIKGRLP